MTSRFCLRFSSSTGCPELHHLSRSHLQIKTSARWRLHQICLAPGPRTLRHFRAEKGQSWEVWDEGVEQAGGISTAVVLLQQEHLTSAVPGHIGLRCSSA